MPVETERLLKRFHELLVEEIAERRPEYLHRPFTVSEIYQDLMPYRTHRDALGVEMNGDYEDALLRLLGGEGDYLILESEHARRAIGQELKRTHPNTGLYREFAAAEVRLHPENLPESIPESPSMDEEAGASDMAGEGSDDPGSHEPGSDEPDPGDGDSREDFFSLGGESHREEGPGTGVAGTPSSGPSPEAPPRGAPDGEEPSDMDLEEPPGEAVEASDPIQPPDGVCRWCKETLPDRDEIRFCPFCGTDVQLIPCRGCGEELEAEWRFCITCGTESRG